jgi:transketolase
LAPAELLERGAYVLADSADGDPQAILLASGSEVHLALAARAQLAAEGIRARVVSMPSWELFAEQDAAYREAVLPPAVRARVAIEAAVPLGWERWVGERGRVLGLSRFGASAPGEVVMEQLGFTASAVVQLVKEVLEQ